MAEITLVRHGQAQTHATDAASYDSLSDLGIKQATWLGDHMRDHSEEFEHVYAGNLQRQHKTAEHMGFAAKSRDARLNEFDYFQMADQGHRLFGIPKPDSEHTFLTNVPKLLHLWQDERLPDMPESFAQFDARVAAVLADIAAPGGRNLVVTSGGIIAMAMRQVLGLDLDGFARILLHTTNTSVHRFNHLHGRLHLAGYNATPHLDTPDRAHARSFV